MVKVDQRQYRTLILAGLLHDIGKLLNKPQPEGGKKHAEYGAEFLRDAELVDRFATFAEDVDLELLRYLVLRHDPYVETDWKLPEHDHLLRVIRAADGYSAGERAITHLYNQRPSGNLALDSIFTQRDLGRPLPETRPFHRPAALVPDASFPDKDIDELTADDYAGVIADFKSAFTYALSDANGSWPRLEAWSYSLLERYTWAVPSALNRDPRDVSLFDHARTSCAIAAALYLYRRSPKADRKRPQFLLIKGDISGIQDYIYSVANVGPGGVAKRLRARSLFVTALTESVAHRLRDELVPGFQLPIAANVINGGGQFVLLVPHLQPVRENLERIERDVNLWLWKEFQGDLAVILAGEPVSGKELAIKPSKTAGGRPRRTINEALADLDHNIEQAKAERLGSILRQNGRWQPDAFLWVHDNYENGDCPSCGRLPARADADEPDIDRRLCERCYRDRLLSESIVNSQYIAYWRGEPPLVNGHQVPNKQRLTLFEGEARRHLVLIEKLAELGDFDESPYQLDGFGYDQPMSGGRPAPPVVRHFASYVPRFPEKADLENFCTAERGCVYDRYFNDERCGILVHPEGGPIETFPILQSFGCLAAASAERDRKMGSQLLGVLRADVDNMRLLFSHSFEEPVKIKKEGEEFSAPVRSLSRVATMSRMIDLFFSGWVHHTLADDFPLIYTVYSGGDDLCLVGPWDILIEFTRHLAKEFERYVAHNPNITLSAAITVTKPKFPIATSARQAGTLLDKAKQAGRSRLNLFGVISKFRSLPAYQQLDEKLAGQLAQQEKHADLLLAALWDWAVLLDEQLARYRDEREAGRRYPISRAFAHRLLRYAEMAGRWEQAEAIRADDMLYLARLAYDLGRNVIKSAAVDKETETRFLELTQLQNKKLMAGMRLPLTYALYRNRERSADDGS